MEVSNPRPLAFDRVVITRDGIPASVGVEEFLRIPLHRRVQSLLARQLQFYQGPDVVETRLALQDLRRFEETRG